MLAHRRVADLIVGQMSRFVTATRDSRDFVHLRYKPVTIETPEDVAEFTRDVATQLVALVGDRKVDIVVDLGQLVVKPSVAQMYDAARRELAANHAKLAFRYSGLSIVRTKILTSSAIHGQHANVYESFEQAVAALLRARDVR